ncbi:MAG: SRPBCC family protein [Haloquadratum sp.]
MQTVTVERDVPRDVETVRERMRDVEAFLRAAGFDTVDHRDGVVEIANQVGPVRIELTLELLDDVDADFAYRQREGLFETMTTTVRTTETDDGTRVEAETDFELGAAVVGSVLDATVIKRQRTRELNAQLEYLAR